MMIVTRLLKKLYQTQYKLSSKLLKKINSRSSFGFSLIELLVVVAILGVLSSIGVLAYNGYVSGTKKKSAENIMQQIALAQQEEYSSYGSYFSNSDVCDQSTTEEIGTNLFDSAGYIDRDRIGYDFCALSSGSTFTIHAKSIKTNCEMSLDSSNNFTKC